MTTDYDEIAYLRLHHPAWVLLRAQNVALVLDFLGRCFVDRNIGDIAAGELAGELDDVLYALNDRLGDDAFPRPASAYLDEWSDPDHAWLRKFYPAGSDEARYSLSPAVEKALGWVRELRVREFVGTQSRLNTIFELLRQMVLGADSDPEHRLADLRRRRTEIDTEIARAELGEVTLLDSVSQRDRYQQFASTARELLADFREVEENFRRLDRRLREQITGWTGSKGALLDEALSNRSSIADSDQGRSFQAFYDFLLSHHRQVELTELLEKLGRIDDLPDQDDRLQRIHFDWIDACERTQTTVRHLSEQLRRFLDDKAWLENRRVFDVLRQIEAKALQLGKLGNHPRFEVEIDDDGVVSSLNLPLERPLHNRPRIVALVDTSAEPGGEDFDASALVDQFFVDRDELRKRVLATLGPRKQVGLREVVDGAPLEHGLAELVGYIALDTDGLATVFDESARETIEWESGETTRAAEMPRVSFARESPSDVDAS